MSGGSVFPVRLACFAICYWKQIRCRLSERLHIVLLPPEGNYTARRIEDSESVHVVDARDHVWGSNASIYVVVAGRRVVPFIESTVKVLEMVPQRCRSQWGILGNTQAFPQRLSFFCSFTALTPQRLRDIRRRCYQVLKRIPDLIRCLLPVFRRLLLTVGGLKTGVEKLCAHQNEPTLVTHLGLENSEEHPVHAGRPFAGLRTAHDTAPSTVMEGVCL